MRLFWIFLFCMLTTQANAEVFRRSTSLDWDPIPDAKFYEVEIQPKAKSSNKEKLKSQMVRGPQWQGSLPLGQYALRVRALDARKVPGDWSAPLDFTVGLEKPKLLFPAENSKVPGKSDDESKVTFRWQAVPGAAVYHFSVTSPDGKVRQTKDLKNTQVTLSLPVATEYTWTVQAENISDPNTQNSNTAKFALWGAKLAAPKVNPPANSFVRQLDWDRPTYAEKFDYMLSRWDNKEKKWVRQPRAQTANTQCEFPENWPGGKYKLVVRANASLRENSALSEEVFTVAQGSRSPAAEEMATVRESIDHTQGWFATASYLITAVNYSGVNADRSLGNPLNVTFNGALGGTGRLGLGYLSSKSPWGFLTIGDDSGITINNTIYNFGSLESNAIYRTNLGERGELRQQFGLFYKQLPVVEANSDGSTTVLPAASIGPHYGLEYWQALTPKFGFQTNAHMYVNGMTVNTPNGHSVNPDLSYQLGFLGSLRLSRTMTGLMGYAYRVDTLSYSANDGSKNSSTLTGNYLNFFLEWQL